MAKRMVPAARPAGAPVPTVGQRPAPRGRVGLEGRPARVSRVRATKLCFYGLLRRRPGDVFDLKRPEDFDPTYMEAVSPHEPLTKPLHGNAALQREHEEILRAKLAQGLPNPGPDLPTGAESVLGG